MRHPPPGGVMGPEAPEAFKRHPGGTPEAREKRAKGLEPSTSSLGS
jgi:hypothetical protein